MKALKFNWTEIKQKSTAFFKNLFNVAVILTSMTVGFLAAQLYNDFTHSTKAALQPTQTLEKTSVAVNERGELMIINRLDGKYTIYDNKVGKVIFDLYASKVYYDQKNP